MSRNGKGLKTSVVGKLGSDFVNVAQSEFRFENLAKKMYLKIPKFYIKLIKKAFLFLKKI